MTRLFRVAFWAALLLAFAMAVWPHPPVLEVSDKLQHMTAFVVLTLLGWVAYPRVSRIKLMLWLIAYGGLIELVQMVPLVHRDGDWHDWLADIVAVAIAAAGAVLARRMLLAAQAE